MRYWRLYWIGQAIIGFQFPFFTLSQLVSLRYTLYFLKQIHWICFEKIKKMPIHKIFVKIFLKLFSGFKFCFIFTSYFLHNMTLLKPTFYGDTMELLVPVKSNDYFLEQVDVDMYWYGWWSEMQIAFFCRVFYFSCYL